MVGGPAARRGVADALPDRHRDDDCGASAIAALAPVLRARTEEIAYSISVIFLFNMLAVLVFPPLGHVLGLSDHGFGLWAGTAVNDTSAVVAAGFAFSKGRALRDGGKADTHDSDRSARARLRAGSSLARSPARVGARQPMSSRACGTRCPVVHPALHHRFARQYGLDWWATQRHTFRLSRALCRGGVGRRRIAGLLAKFRPGGTRPLLLGFG